MSRKISCLFLFLTCSVFVASVPILRPLWLFLGTLNEDYYYLLSLDSRLNVLLFSDAFRAGMSECAESHSVLQVARCAAKEITGANEAFPGRTPPPAHCAGSS